VKPEQWFGVSLLALATAAGPARAEVSFTSMPNTGFDATGILSGGQYAVEFTPTGSDYLVDRITLPFTLIGSTVPRPLLVQLYDHKLVTVPGGVLRRRRGSADPRRWLIAYRKGLMPDGRRACRSKDETGEDRCDVVHYRGRAGLDLRDPAQAVALRDHLATLDLGRLR
jgi:hypothetical protein